ncbi:MAG: rhomboid family intramembrane serine protease [Chloroflexota bacterium]|nr:rhomboid family intramembrane serine protease [Chloroflexota bacterium]
MVRAVARVLLWLVIVAGGLLLLVFVAVAVTPGDERVRAVIVGLVILAISVAAWFGQRALGRRRGEHEGSGSAPAVRAATVEIPPRDVLTLRPRRLKWILVALGCGGFALLFLVLLLSAPGLFVALGLAFFGPLTVVSVWQLVPGAAYLQIGPQGLVLKGPLRTLRHSWDEVEHFQVYEVRTQYSTQRFVGFDLRDRVPESQSFWQTLSRGISGVDAGLPDTYGRDPDELAELLQTYRDRYRTGRGPSPSERADRQLAAAAAAVDTSHPPVVTAVLALVCLVVFVVQARAHGLAPTAPELRTAGGVSAEAISEGRWWTLLIANVLHANVVHLGLNLAALGIAGWLLEREIGSSRMLALVLLAGLASMGLAVALTPEHVTVGVSGVVFALLTWAVVRDLHRTRALGTFAWSTLPIAVIYTFLSPGTSIGGHLGGLLAGLALGRVFERPSAKRNRSRPSAKHTTS